MSSWLSVQNVELLKQLVQFFRVLVHQSQHLIHLQNGVVFAVHKMQVQVSPRFVHSSVLIRMYSELVDVHNSACDVAQNSEEERWLVKLSIMVDLEKLLSERFDAVSELSWVLPKNEHDSLVFS